MTRRLRQHRKSTGSRDSLTLPKAPLPTLLNRKKCQRSTGPSKSISCKETQCQNRLHVVIQVQAHLWLAAEGSHARARLANPPLFTLRCRAAVAGYRQKGYLYLGIGFVKVEKRGAFLKEKVAVSFKLWASSKPEGLIISASGKCHEYKLIQVWYNISALLDQRLSLTKNCKARKDRTVKTPKRISKVATSGHQKASARI